MRWPWTAPPLPQQNTGPTQGEMEQRIEKLERNMRMFEGDREDWLNKFKTLTARISRQLERAEAREGAQDAPGSTIPPSGGVTPHVDRWTALRDARAQRRAAQ